MTFWINCTNFFEHKQFLPLPHCFQGYTVFYLIYRDFLGLCLPIYFKVVCCRFVVSGWTDLRFICFGFIKSLFIRHIFATLLQTGSTTSTLKTEAGLKFSHDDVTRVLNDVTLMKGKQEAFTSKMDKMKK